MTDKEESVFEKLATEAILAAERVDCHGSVFVEGLKLMAAQIEERAQMSEGEFSADD
jgi:hypothetical protein